MTTGTASTSRELSGHLARLHHQRFSGTLVVTHGRWSHRIQWLRGLVLGASLAGHFDPLGQILLRQGKLDRGMLLGSLERLTGSERLQGQLLCEMGLVSLQEVEQALQQQLRHRLLLLLGMGTPVKVGTDSRPARVRGPCRPLHPLASIWCHVERIPAQSLLDFRRRLAGVPVGLRAGRTLPLWLVGGEGLELLQRLRKSLDPAALTRMADLRLLLFLWKTEAITGCSTQRPTPARRATAAELRSAFRRLALQLHPDRHPSADREERARLAERFARAVEVYRQRQQEATS